MIVSDADIIEALQKYRGIVTSAAKQVGMTRSSLSRRIHRTKHLEEELHEIRETAVDDAEHMLFQKIEEGHVASIIFFLKCFGKDRGYVERPERTNTPPRGQVVIPRRELTLEEWEANNRALERGKDF